ncbi:histidinol-phosphatase [Telmatospirillum sp. J64-1]|uniref:histidinol-phosphatase n=1 Tax=Telmatospirillum sp. J64-1 TaxID=2502183 RepID=UPI00115E26D5|nr:histidinol-phosphatase [Telmatospirillum sp. J64-1]
MAETACPADFIALSEKLADAAGAVIRGYFRTAVGVDDKSDDSPVTIADREAEAAMRRLIAETFPEHGIFGEEFGSERLDADYVWVLDPIDGTKSFITGKPIFGTLIGLLHRDVPILGIIDQPIAGERWLGAKGRGTTLNGKKISTRACPSLSQATICTTAPELLRGPGDLDSWHRLRDAAKLPMYGGDCYNYALVASGFADLVVESGLKPYDYCALIPVIEEAGGLVTDWQGQRLGGMKSDGRVLAAGDSRAHAEAIRILAG